MRAAAAHGQRLQRMAGLDAGAAAAQIAFERGERAVRGRLRVTALEYGRAAARVGAELLRGPRPATIDAIGEALAGTYGCSTSTSTPTTTAPCSPAWATTGRWSTRSSRPWRSRASGSTSARTRGRIRGSAVRRDVVPMVALRQSDVARAPPGGAPHSARGSAPRLPGLPLRAARPRPGLLPPRRCRGAAPVVGRRRARPDFGPARLDPAVGRRPCRRPAAADRVQRQPARPAPRREGDRPLPSVSAAGRSPACGRSGSRSRSPARAGLDKHRDWEAASYTRWSGRRPRSGVARRPGRWSA